LSQVQATNDGALYVGTKGKGLWKMEAGGSFAQVKDVPGSEVKQIVYEPGFAPPMLIVVTDAGVTVLRDE
jgi:hypothetical protein